jgi:hypothetical protein
VALKEDQTYDKLSPLASMDVGKKLHIILVGSDLIFTHGTVLGLNINWCTDFFFFT